MAGFHVCINAVYHVYDLTKGTFQPLKDCRISRLRLNNDETSITEICDEFLSERFGPVFETDTISYLVVYPHGPVNVVGKPLMMDGISEFKNSYLDFKTFLITVNLLRSCE